MIRLRPTNPDSRPGDRRSGPRSPVAEVAAVGRSVTTQVAGRFSPVGREVTKVAAITNAVEVQVTVTVGHSIAVVITGILALDLRRGGDGRSVRDAIRWGHPAFDRRALAGQETGRRSKSPAEAVPRRTRPPTDHVYRSRTMPRSEPVGASTRRGLADLLAG